MLFPGSNSNNDNENGQNAAFDWMSNIGNNNEDDSGNNPLSDLLGGLGDNIADLIDGVRGEDDSDNSGAGFSGSGLGEWFDNLNITEGDWLPPCPPGEFFDRVNITKEEFPCDPDFEFPDDISSNFTDTLPCPPQDFLDHLNITLEDLPPCNPDLEFPSFDGNFTDKIPCPTDEFLERFNLTVEDLPCNPDLERPSFPDWDGNYSFPCPSDEVLDRLGNIFNVSDFPCDPNATRPQHPGGSFTGGRPEIECEEAIACGRAFGKTGIVVCAQSLFGGDTKRSTCIDPARASDDATCGLCAGDAAIVECGCECDAPFSDEMGVLVVSQSGFGNERCVTKEDAVSKQLNGRYACVTECPTP